VASINLIQPTVREADARLLGIVGDMKGATIFFSEDDGRTAEWKEEVFDADTIGNYLGKGVGGMVFRLQDDDGIPINKVLKMVKLLPSDESFMEYAQKQPLGVHKKAWNPLVGSKVLAMNEFQAQLFQELSQLRKGILEGQGGLPKVPDAIPIVYSCAKGTMNQSFRDKVYEAQSNNPMDAPNFKLFNDNFPIGTHIAYWIMEYIPCTDESTPAYCGFAPSAENRPASAAELAKDPRFRKEQKGYQDVSHFLHSMGWVVRDTINPGNFGYRENGEVVFFDLFVIPWPPSRVEGELKQMAHSLITKQDIIDFRHTIKNGHYFNRRTQAGAYSAETEGNSR
tara:strand:- start:4189 stop:5205 length:1017 start_codon:yes stop_codon:yes gene_type:complete